MKRYMLICCALLCAPVSSQAGTIDFETGLGDLWSIGTLFTFDNEVSFRVGNGAPTQHATVTEVGGPQTAFAPNDTPDGGAGGKFFLSDEANGPSIGLDYFIEFIGADVSDLSLDLYDYRADGGASVGDTAKLSAFSDVLGGTLVGTSTFTITAGLPQGNVAHLSIPSPSGNIRWAQLTFSAQDIGTGIDNIQFKTVPEPTGIASVLFGISALWSCVRRKRPE